MTLELMSNLLGYRIEDQLGSGAHGVVYLAVDENGRRIALKVIHTNEDPDSQIILEAERLGASIQKKLAEIDPHVPFVYSQDLMDGKFYVAMEYIEGQDLSRVMHLQLPTPEEIIYYATEIAKTLKSAHSCPFETESGKAYHGIVHGDIKPRNIRIDTKGQVRILDFGISKALSQTTRIPRSEFGTLPYCSPERLDHGTLEAADDLWSLGVIVYELAAGRKPFHAENGRELERLICARQPPPPLPSGIPALIRGFVEKALAPQLGARFASADEMLLILDSWTQEETRRIRRPEPSILKDAPAQTPVEEDDIDTGALSGRNPDPAPTLSTPARQMDSQLQTKLSGQANKVDLEIPNWLVTPIPAPQIDPHLYQQPKLHASPPLRPTMRLLANFSEKLVSKLPPKSQALMRQLQPLGQTLLRLPLPAHLFFVLLTLLVVESYHYSQAQAFALDLKKKNPIEVQEIEPFLNKYKQMSFWTPLSSHKAKAALVTVLSKAAARVIEDFGNEQFRVRSSDWKEASFALEALVELAPSNHNQAQLQYCQAQSLRIAAQGRKSAEADQLNNKALALFKSAIEIMPRWPDPHLGLAMFYLYNTSDFEKASQSLDKVEDSPLELGRRLDYLRGEIDRYTAEKMYRELPKEQQDRRHNSKSREWWRNILEGNSNDSDQSSEQVELTIERYQQALAHYEDAKSYADSRQRMTEIRSRLKLLGE